MKRDEVPTLGSHLLALAALWLLLLMSVGVSRLPLGQMNAVITTAVAVAQACMVLVIFMRLKNGSSTLRVVAVLSFSWPLLLVILTLGDYMMRSPLHWPW
jgi:cytochrome c oxidase subunit IV